MSSARWMVLGLFFSACSSTSGAQNATPADGGSGADSSSQTASDSGTPSSSTDSAATMSGSEAEGGGEAASEGAPTSGGGDCFGACCMPHTIGDSCPSSEEGQYCPTGKDCPGGLALDAKVVCQQGVWREESEPCPAIDGGVSAEGCPAVQPAPGDACSVPDGSGGCTYHLVCAPQPCDAGSATSTPDSASPSSDSGDVGAGGGVGCASVSGKTAFAVCMSGRWSTEPLGTCP